MQPVKAFTDRFFPAAEYTEKCKANPALTPMWLIARGQRLETIQKNIQTNEAAGRAWNNPHPTWKFTPLHVAVWRQDSAVVAYLLQENKCNPDVPDIRGLLPIHYAEASENMEIVRMLRTATKVDHTSYAAFWAKLLVKPAVPGDAKVFSYINDDGKTVEGNAATFSALTGGATFVPTIFFRDRDAVLEELAYRLEKAAGFAKARLQYDVAKIAELTAGPVPLSLAKQGPAGWGVVATQALKPFVPVVIYAGEGTTNADVKKSTTYGDYILKPIDAGEYRNLGGMVNDGFPNCFFDEIFHPSGISYSVVVPIRPIALGEGLFVDYGVDHDIKRMRRSELNLAEAREFLKQGGGLLKICRDEFLPLVEQVKMQTRNGKIDQSLLQDMIVSMIRVKYLFTTPIALIELGLEKLILPAELMILASDEKYAALIDSEKKFQEVLQLFATTFETFEKVAVKFKGDLFGEIRSTLQNLSLTNNAEVVVAVVVSLGESFKLMESISLPKNALELELKMFQPAFPAFEITQTCQREKRDLTDQELQEVQKIIKALPMMESIYQGTYTAEKVAPYPKLKKFREERTAAAESQVANPAEGMSRALSLMQSMIPPSKAAAFQAFMDQLAANPQALGQLGMTLQQ